MRIPDRTLLRDVSALAAAVLAVGVSYGAIAVAAGLPTWAIVTMSVLVFAGGAQFLATALIAAGNPVAAIIGGLVLNARHLPFGLVIAGVLAPASGQPEAPAPSSGRLAALASPADPIGPAVATEVAAPPTPARARRTRTLALRLIGSHLMVDESVAFALAQRDPARRRTAYWLTGVTLFVVWNVGTLVGLALGGAVGDPATFGLDAAFPAGLIALLLPTLREPRPLRVAAVGAAVAVLATPFVPAGLPVLLALVGLAALGRPPLRVRP